MRILDCGGGPGRYSIELARLGHKVTLLDLSAVNLEYARSKAREHSVEISEFLHQSASDLANLATESFDIVLNLGPVYHIVDDAELSMAIRESLRVLKPTGRLFVAGLNKYSLYNAVIRNDLTLLSSHGDSIARVFEHGKSVAMQGIPGFTDSRYIEPHEFRRLLEGYGLQVLNLVGVEGGFASSLDKIRGLDGDSRRVWVEQAKRLAETEYGLYGSDHLLAVTEKE